VEVLRWEHDSGYELHNQLDKLSIAPDAAFFGHLDVVKYPRTLGIKWDTCTNAALSGTSSPWDEDTCSYAASKGYIALLQWARAQQCPWDEDTCSYAATMNGHLELLKWARASLG